RTADQQISTQYGLYDDPELAAYVERLGQSMATKSERPHLPWTFRVLDDPVINAFALPGGYIYITRGILAHMGSEAELVSVLGHEIGHVTARHGVNQLSKQQLAGLGLGVGMILAPELARSVGDLAQAGMQLLFLKYGRDDERQADELGFRYMGHIGANPEGAVEMFAMLGSSGKAAGGDRLPGYLSTHPDPDARRLAAQARLRDLPPEVLDRPWGRAELVRKLDGITYGPDPREGFFDGRAFVHPGMAMRIDLPAGWKGFNQKTSVVAVSPNQDAILHITLAQGRTLDEAARNFYGQQGLRVRDSWRDTSETPLSATRLFSAGDGPDLYGAAGFVDRNGTLLRLMAIAKPEAWSRWENAMETSLESFGELRDREQLSVEPMRVEIVELRRDMTIEQFADAYPSSISIERLALLNHASSGEVLPAGTLAKRVEGFDGGPQMGVELK
ncbi:MAG: M48 family metalloprotease, partial [Holophagales bacterium]|nr:M48 family metalloprotease [Holophagales bacterium]